MQFCGFADSGRKAKMKDGGRGRLTKKKKVRRKTMSEPRRFFAERHGGQGTLSAEMCLEEGRNTITLKDGELARACSSLFLLVLSDPVQALTLAEGQFLL